LAQPNIRPFISRKVGLTDSGLAVPLIAGLRLNGYLDPKTRIEVIDVQSGRLQNDALQNYYTTVIERQILQRSNITAYITDEESSGNSISGQNSIAKYNRVAGTEFILSLFN